MSHKVFISHSSKDSEYARIVCEAIEQEGIPCWIAPRDIDPGTQYAEVIVDAIASSKLIVLVFSTHSSLSPQVIREIERAVSKSLPILPIKIDSTMPRGSFEFFVMSCQWLDATDPPFESHMHRLVDSVKRLVSSETTTVSEKSSSQGREIAAALEHCQSYRAMYQMLEGGSFDEPLPRDQFGISRSTTDLLSERESRQGQRFLTPPQVFAEEQLLAQLENRERRRLWLLGSGGSGKTEFTKHCAIHLANKFIDNPYHAALPIRIELKSLDPSVPCNSADRLLQNHLLTDEWSWIKPFLESGRIIFLLDGMDELRLDPLSFHDSLVKLIHQRRDCSFVLAGRGELIEPSFVATRCFAESDAHRLKSISNEQAQNYIRAYFRYRDRADEATPLIDALSNDITLQELVCSTPLLLTLACQVLLMQRKVASNPVDLIQFGLESIFERRRSRSTGQEFPGDDLCMSVLSCLAANSVVDDMNARNGTLVFARRDALRWLKECRLPLEADGLQIKSEADARNLLNQLAPGSGVIAWMSDNTLCFGHRVIAEYLAAHWVVEHGYPRWPYVDESYTFLPDQLDRQIADFFGDLYWNIEYSGIRNWLGLLLQRRRGNLYKTLLEWQLSTLKAVAKLLPPQFKFGIDELGTILPRLLYVIKRVRRLGQHDLADGLYDAVFEALDFKTMIYYVSPWDLLEGCSRGKAKHLMSSLYGDSTSLILSEMGHIILPNLIELLDGVKDDYGRLLGLKDCIDIAEGVAFNLMANERVQSLQDVKDNGSCPLGSIQHIEWNDTDYHHLLALLATNLPSGMLLWDILLFLQDRRVPNLEFPKLAKSLLERTTSDDSSQRSAILITWLIHAIQKGEKYFLDLSLQLFEKIDCERILPTVLSTALKLGPASVELLQELARLPIRLRTDSAWSEAATSQFAVTIAESMAVRINQGEVSLIEPLRNLYEQFPEVGSAFNKVLSDDLQADLGVFVASAMVENLASHGWGEEAKTLEKLNWLQFRDPESYKVAITKMNQFAEQICASKPFNHRKVAAIVKAKATREKLGFSHSLLTELKERQAAEIERFGSCFPHSAVWEEFKSRFTDWKQDIELLCTASELSEPFEDDKNVRFIIALLEFNRRNNCSNNEFADRLIEILKGIDTEIPLEWIRQEPTGESLRGLYLKVLKRRKGKSLVGADTLIRLGASTWPEDPEIRRSCIDLIREEVNPSTHWSTLERTAIAILESWVGEMEVLKELTEAGLGYAITKTRAWDQWVVFWQDNDRSSHIPHCSTGYIHVPVVMGSSVETLYVGQRSNLRRGLPAQLVK